MTDFHAILPQPLWPEASPEKQQESWHETLRRVAMTDAAEAQFDAGCNYAFSNRSEASRWLALADENGSRYAALVAAEIWTTPECSPTGEITDADRAEAEKWYTLGRKRLNSWAKAGDGWALYWLARLHEEGHGGPKNLKEAAKCYRAAIRRGYRCHHDLCLLFGTGEVKPASMIELCVCLRAAIASGDETARTLYSKTLKALTPAQRRRLKSIQRRRPPGL